MKPIELIEHIAKVEQTDKMIIINREVFDRWEMITITIKNR